MTRPSVRPPVDRRLPGSELLFDMHAVRAIVGKPDDAEPRLRYVEHEPGASALVVVEVGDRLAAISIGRTAAVAAGPQVAWYPDDPALPGIRDGWDGLWRLLDLPAGEPQRLAWVPHRRLVVAAGDLVVKLHARPDETERAVACARTAGEVVAVPDVVRVDVDRAVHVQRRVEGRALTRGDAERCVDDACDVLGRLHSLDSTRLVRYTPADLLAHCGQVARLVSFIAPETAGRLGTMLDRLDRTAPGGAGVVACHGDFNVGQLLAAEGGGLVVVDTDTLCAAHPAYDAASYAANLVAGRPADLDDARRVLQRCAQRLDLDANALDWYVAAMVVRRLDRGFRRYKRSWPARTAHLLEAADELVACL